MKKVKTVKTKMEKTAPNDGGLSPKEIERLRKAIRQVWHWTSFARRLVIKRCTLKDGFSKCESCHKKVPKILVDHITPCGAMDEGYIRRLFVSSRELQGLCKKCHNKKTYEERALIKLGLVN